MLRFLSSLLKRIPVLSLILVGSFLVFWHNAATALDSDFGWHIAMGKLLLAHGIPSHEPFSYTMSSYPYIDHEWLTNILYYLSFSTIHWQGMAVLTAFLGVLSVFVLVDLKKRNFSMVPAVLALTVLIPRLTIREQVISWVLWSLTLFVVLTPERWKKWRWSLPFLLLVWVNMHGSFPLGLMVIAIASFFYREKKHIDIENIGVAFISFLVTFLNPYGWRLWHEVWMQLSAPGLHTAIIEWGPFWTRPELAMMAMVTFVGFFCWRYRTSLSRLSLVILGGTFLLSLSAIRHVPFFMLAALPVVTDLFEQFFMEIKNIPFGPKRFTSFYNVLLLICLVIFCGEAFLSFNAFASFREDSYYPKSGIAYLETHPFSGHLFSFYGWGGYLIWKYPQQKVFVDGRMPSFRWQAPKGQSDNAFTEYQQLLQGKNIEVAFSTYDITTVLLPVADTSSDIWERIALFLLRKPENNKFSFFDYLTSHGWKEVFRDQVSIIYER